ncbi:UDP-2,4-diacetamido-2,4,6-trideoxy-beta-L-altropyranose hydrolase [Hymenobacter sp. UV11]|uniref:UDP-2,4-diacetamido-2,4, 6-trideoxy-beta-L-altropyranose hydrolase n=1 Tax=Hymenobacter sp. UV11 TaxID=1849735 RepID=UPI00105C3934|nr:UDP-2,4-diacetamido-2,4,6-trideoxy-beta-L-altropyranose hydrolase [Hymenobacter sp. UV11]TFZ65129.1 UDP-2,4-diacetamido-2,4,6-trideoxy-beta-L-altropyranose hydrolase [Hymenobacter sp. UV11]
MKNSAERRLVFRVDGDAIIGLGHVVRLLALADILRGLAPSVFLIRAPSEGVRQLLNDAGWPVYALPVEPSLMAEAEWLTSAFLLSTDVLLLDGYSFDFAYQSSLRRSGCGLVFIDDLRAWPVVADVLINHSPGVAAADYEAPNATSLLLGPAFSLLRQPFLAAATLPQSYSSSDSVLICFGGADPLGLTVRTLIALSTLPQLHRVSIVVGGAFSSTNALQQAIKQSPMPVIELHRGISAAALVELLQTHAVIIVPASTVLIEALVLGRPAITGYYADNQRYLADYVQQHAQAFSIGSFAESSPIQLATLLNQGLNFFASHSPLPYVDALRPDLLRTAIQDLLNC